MRSESLVRWKTRGVRAGRERGAVSAGDCGRRATDEHSGGGGAVS